MAKKTWSQKYAQMSRRDRLLIWTSLLVGVSTLIVTAVMPKDIVEYKTIGYIGMFFAVLITTAPPITFVPATAITFLASRFLDPIPLIVVAGIAASLGENVSYFLGDGVNMLVEDFKWHKTMKKWFYKAPFLFLVIWIALPNPIQTLGQVFAGSANYPFWKYFLASTIGNFIWFAVLVYAGDTFFHLLY